MITISIPRQIIEGIFSECDRFDDEETGGRLIGFYTWPGTNLHIDVKALISAGLNTRRSRVSLFQDGIYQERIFRAVEKQHPRIEHLGNWHTHHVNSLRSLSQGDCDTYRKCVNSSKHNTNFFYAMLVTHRTPCSRYAIRHFVFIRGENDYVEIPSGQVDTSGNRILGVAS